MLAPGMGDEAVGRGLPWGPLPPWEELRARVRRMPGLCPPGTAGCPVCRGLASPGYPTCYQCAEHERLAHGLLADVVVPISYAVRGSEFARDLWRYKSWRGTDANVRAALLALLLVFLDEHGDCVWRAAGMSSPDRLAVVPSGCGRDGPHPLLAMVAPGLRLPLIPLRLRPGEQGRDLNAGRFAAGGPVGSAPVAGADVLLIDDTWVSGGSVQSAAAALKREGAAHVAAVLLGRYVNPARTGPARLATTLTTTLKTALPTADDRYDLARCVLCGNM